MSKLLGTNLPDLLVKRAVLAPKKAAYLRKRFGAWVPASWAETEDKVFRVAQSLKLAGVKAGERVAILAQTRPEWMICDLAIMSLGAVTVPIYSAVMADDVHFILKDSRVTFIFVEDNVQRQKVLSVIEQLKLKIELVSLDRSLESGGQNLESWIEENTSQQIDGEFAFSEANLKSWRQQCADLDSQQLATIVYTSGTQGLPKGVQLTHANFVSILGSLAQTMDLTERDVSLFFLPAAHIMGRIEQMMSLAVGMTNAYAESLSHLIDNMQEVKPTLLVSVPRVYEKLFASIQHRFHSEGLVTREGFKLAMNTGIEHSRVLQRGAAPDTFLKLRYATAEKLYFSKIREKLGGRIRFTISGGAPLSIELAEFFHACGILVLEGYGLTETTGPACLNRPSQFKFGSVGLPMPGCEIKIADDQEILLRGPMLSSGYFEHPQETAQAFENEWFHTGDVGSIDENGFVTITDRKKDIIITSGGKNIAPVRIENNFKADELFSNVVVVGEGKPFLSAFITLNVSEAKRLASELKLKSENLEDLIRQAPFYELVEQRVAKVNEKMAAYERIRRFRLLPRELSIEAGELTPSLKVRRRFFHEKYAHLIREMYTQE